GTGGNASGTHKKAAGAGGSARPSIGLDPCVAAPPGPLAELAPVVDGAQRPADEPLNLLRSAARPAVLPLRPGVGRSREHRVLGGDPPLPLTLQKGRHLVLDRRGADDLRRAELHEHRALGMQEVISGDDDGPELVGGAAVGPGLCERTRAPGAGRAAARPRWPQARLYSTSPAKMARAISSRYFVSLRRRSSFGLVTKPISIRIAGIAAPPRT